MPTPIELIFDFGSPNAYLSWKVLPGLAREIGAPVTITPALLGGIFKATGNQAPMMAFGGVKGKLDYESLEMRRFIEKHALTRFRFNPNFPVNTLVLMRGLVAAQAHGVQDAYLEAGLAAMWEDGEPMADPDTFVRVMDAAGLNGAQLLEQTQDPEVKGTLAANTDHAVERGVFGIPTFFVGTEMFFGKERLGQVIEAAAL
ncbi:2-hydroxychromene-2-carboxylate isomerase [soil metagenome]